MSWDIFGDIITTAEAAALTQSVKFKFENSQLLLVVRARFIFYNDPALTAIGMRIYSDNGGVPGKLIYTSETTHTKATLLTTEDHGVKEGYWSFNAPGGVVLRHSTYFHLVPVLTGYTGDDSSHVAWKKAFPDPAYDTGIETLQTKHLHLIAREAWFLGAEL